MASSSRKKIHENSLFFRLRRLAEGTPTIGQGINEAIAVDAQLVIPASKPPSNDEVVRLKKRINAIRPKENMRKIAVYIDRYLDKNA